MKRTTWNQDLADGTTTPCRGYTFGNGDWGITDQVGFDRLNRKWVINYIPSGRNIISIIPGLPFKTAKYIAQAIAANPRFSFSPAKFRSIPKEEKQALKTELRALYETALQETSNA